MKSRKSFLPILAAVCFGLASAQSPAESTIAADVSSDQPCPVQNNVWGFCVAYDFNTFVYYMFLLQTNDTAEPADVNDIYIVSSHDDDPNGFYRVFLLP